MKKKEKDLNYKIFSMRLNEDTKDLLKYKYKKSGLSWNLFIYNLLKRKK